MRSNYERCLQYVLESEGFFDGKKGETDDPSDNGGFTIGGVTIFNYCEWMKMPVPTRPWRADIVAAMRRLTLEDMKNFYYRTKWVPAQCDLLPPGVDYCAFDVCVLHGPGRAIKYLQRVLRVTEDGVPGPKTQAAIRYFNASANPDTVHAAISTLHKAREDHFAGIVANNPSQKKWLNGWQNRINKVLHIAIEMSAVVSRPSTGPLPMPMMSLITDVGRADDANKSNVSLILADIATFGVSNLADLASAGAATLRRLANNTKDGDTETIAHVARLITLIFVPERFQAAARAVVNCSLGKATKSDGAALIALANDLVGALGSAGGVMKLLLRAAAAPILATLPSDPEPAPEPVALPQSALDTISAVQRSLSEFSATAESATAAVAAMTDEEFFNYARNVA